MQSLKSVFFFLGSSTPLSPQPSVSLTESASTLSSEDVSDLPVEDSGILAEYTSDGLEERDVGTDSDASTIVDEPLEVSFVFKSNPTKIKLDCLLLSGFCMESAVQTNETTLRY